MDIQNMKRIFGVLLLLISVSLPAQASWQSAATEVEKSIEQMLEKVVPYRGQVDADLEPLYEQLAAVTAGNVDYPYLSKIVMGKHYRRASDQEKALFLTAFTRTLVKTYGKTLVSFDIKGYKLQKNRTESPKPNKQKVIVNVTSAGGKSYSLINYMVQKDGKWKLVNIVLDGFNLRVTFKNQFSKMVQQSKGDIGAAITKWSKVMSKK